MIYYSQKNYFCQLINIVIFWIHMTSDTKEDFFMQKIRKTRNWAFIVYPESAPEDWRKTLSETGLPFAVSPLHDADLNADESEKKAHWHVLTCYGGPTTLEVVKMITEPINATIPQSVHSLRGYYRYFTHKDNPEKTQYLETNIDHFNGFRKPDFTEMTASEKYEIKLKIMDVIDELDIRDYDVLCKVLREQGEDGQQYAYYAMSSTIFFTAYLTSRRNRLKNEYEQQNQ